MTKRILFGLAIVLAGCAIYIVGSAALFRSSRLDAYPPFMAGIQPTPPYVYEDVRKAFSRFVAERFPVGSDARGAVAQITGNGFSLVRSKPMETYLLWKRSAFPCTEEYRIIVQANEDGSILKIDGKLIPICL
jgi:hypothetical protein